MTSAPLHCTSVPGGDPVLWVHGYTLDGTIWAPVWQGLPGFAHVAPDLPGHGRSRGFSRRETLDTLAEAVLATADAVGARKLVGMSFGGMVALQAAIKAPQRFSHVVLASPGLAGGPQDQDAASCNQELIRMAAERGGGPWLAERWMSVPPRIFAGTMTRPALRQQLQDVVARHGWAELGEPVMQNILSRPQQPADIATISSDLLLLVGEDDMPAFLRCAEIIRRNAPHARRETVDNAVHLCLLEEPQTCANLIRDHFASRGGQGDG